MIPIKLPRENKEQIISKLQAFFVEERSEEIGNIAAEQILDFMILEIGPYIYNHAIADARKLMNDKMLSMVEDLYVLEKPLKR